MLVLKVQKSIDFGTIKAGSDGKRSFSITNPTNRVVKVSLHSTCGCTVIDKLDQIAPNTTVQAQFKYDTSRIGKINKTIVVFEDGDQQESHRVQIIGTVINA